ncbi:Flp pilus assembly protein CpaB [Allosphingosinicella indica]|uniref:Pilus assembly protein CpaB n=1 Tax=Allosphingosinicella indica TaxID=941907 RepID=A0A1X7FYY9_9SPHN|nr:Flp pilus assembly protein CpaB [Allosphingosinicella indica]SMF61301.1 pilus assembly protein CpaB [Allosphingosinicella indica]
MDVKKIVLLVGALAIAAMTAIMAKNMFTGAAAPQAAAAQVPANGPEILVATRPLPVGTIIDAEALRYQRWPEELVQPVYFVKANGADAASLIGTVVRNEITAGQPLTQGSLIKPGERGFLAAALGPGMRAVTVAVSSTSGVAGFIFPGDRVDVVLTQEVAGGGDGSPLRVAETVLSNVRVLATDQRMSGTDENGKPVVNSTSTVTLETTPRIAEKIAVAQTLGTVSLSLRSIADNSADLERAIAAGEVNVPDGDDPAAEQKMLLAVANRPSEGGGATFTTGADVSRFARRTVPAKPAQGPVLQEGVPAPAGAAPAVPAGPIVRVARGNSVTVVPVGAK